MLTREEDIDAHALHAQGWTIAAIARHLGRDRKTIRAHLTGLRVAGVRARQGPDAFAPFAEYVRARLAEDPHLWAATLADELEELGWGGGYSTLTRQIRDRGLRPVCEPCRGLKDRPVAIIEHPPGAETQWDWLECPASSCWQVLGLGKVGGQRVGQAQVDLQGPVPGDRLVRSHCVVLGPVVVGVRDEGQDVVDLFEEEPLVLQGAEPAFA